MTDAGVYVRISEDRGGAGLGVARQQQDCEALCARLGWRVAGVYTDNDTSAYTGAPRPQWDRLLADVAAGAVHALAVWHVDRLTRSPRELEDVIALADRHGLALATVSGEIDLATPTGRMVARIMGAAARHESEHKAERQRREHRQRAEAGRVAGGGHRPFGYEADRVSVHADEAAIVRELAGRALAGESLSGLCRWLAEQGVPTTAGNPWRVTPLRDLLCSARISGRREHAPRRPDGTRPVMGEIIAPAVWPAIITPEQSDRLRTLLTAPGRRRSNAVGRTYLLSGILRCGRCGAGLVGRPRSGVPRYVCPNTPGGRSCGRLATLAEPTDAHIRDMVLAALAGPGLAAVLHRRGSGGEAEIVARLRAAEDRLAELAADYASGAIGRGEWRAARTVLDRQIGRDRNSLARASSAAAVADWTGGVAELAARWEGLDVARRRALVAAVVDTVTVAPARPGRTFQPDRFTVIWRA